MTPTPRHITRLAPSPTGALHLGNARTFLINWALARAGGWRVLLRIEDLDSPRVKPGAADRIADTLTWLGLDWDHGPTCQSHDLDPYRDAMRVLAERAMVYPCSLTRTEVERAASAPHADQHETRFPKHLRPSIQPGTFADERTNWRFVVREGDVGFADTFLGPQTHSPAQTVGDFVVWTRRGQPSYQLAVVVDDHRQGVTQVVRGADLLDSTARQLLLQRALGLTPEPTYTHLPLVVGPDGRRLAKRHGDTRIETYRDRGVPAGRIIAMLARWSGIEPNETMTAHDFVDAFDLSTMSHDAVVFGSEDDRWLRARPG